MHGQDDLRHQVRRVSETFCHALAFVFIFHCFDLAPEELEENWKLNDRELTHIV
jgi:predicted kinase